MMATHAVEKAAAETNGAPPVVDEGVVCVVDLGEQSRKRVKRLRRGKGRLMSKIERVVDDLQEEGVLKAGAQTVVVVVREEASLGGFFSSDDDDD
jgi:hypothetical protein